MTSHVHPFLRWRFLGCLLVVLLGCGRHAPSDSLDKQTPDFKLASFKNTQHFFELSKEVKSRPVLLVFWTTWCPSCIKETSLLNQWVKLYPHLEILAINAHEKRAEVEGFYLKNPFQFEVLMDETGEVSKKYQIQTLPTIILLAKGGKILYYGFTLPKQLESLIHKETVHGSS